MSNKKAFNSKTLFIGCGGSGITTLLRVNELLAGNPATRQRIREDISYLVIDTEVKKVETFKDQVKDQMLGAGEPLMRLVQVSKGFVNLDDIVHPNIDGQKDPARKALIRQHWWFAPNEQGVPSEGEPFRAIAIHDIFKGAGQCGPISFLTTWNYLPQLEEDVMSILEEIQIRNTDDPKALENLRVYIVTGTAGGTGRGCWNLVAFKIRQCLKKFGVQVEPSGIFFDATCFKNVWVESPGEKIKNQMNSLTGMSELSAWLRLPKEGSFKYELPNLSRPDTTGKVSVLKVEDSDKSGMSPISAAYLIFGNNGSAHLKDNTQYHEMAAAALYALVAADTFIAPGNVNRPEMVRSFAATTFEIDTVKIRRYMETMVRLHYSQSLYNSTTSTEEEANGMVGKVKDELDEKSFLSKTGFCVLEPVTATSLGGDAGSKTILQKLMAKAKDAVGFDTDQSLYTTTSNFEKALNEQDKLRSTNIVRELLDNEDVRGDVIDAVEKVLLENGLDDQSLDNTLKKLVMDAFYVPGSKDRAELKPSVARARALIKILEKVFNKSVENLMGTDDAPVTIAVAGDVTVKDAEDCANKFISGPLEAASDRKATDFFKMFSKEEIISLKEDFQSYQTASLFFCLQTHLAKKFKRASEGLKLLDTSLQILENALEDVKKEFEQELCKKFDCSSTDEVFDKIFVRDDDDAIFASLPTENSYLTVYRRVLRPIFNPEAIADMMKDPVLNGGPISKRLVKDVEDLIIGKRYESSDDARHAIKKAFVGLVTDNVSLPSVNGMTFMDANFSFMKILEHNLERWNRLLKNRWAAEDTRGIITDRFRIFLGVGEEDLGKTDQNQGRIEPDTLLANIVASMVKTCRPWIQLKGTAEMRYLKTIALVPVELKAGTDEEEEFETRVKSKCEGRNVDIFHRGSKASGGDTLPVDRIVLFSATAAIPSQSDEDQNPFNYISSLDYWNDAKLQQLLVYAEDRNALGYFEPSRSRFVSGWSELDNTYGYVSPIFVFNEQLSELRWRPWKPVSEDIDRDKQQHDDTMQAMLFALLGSGNLSTEAREAVAGKNWDAFPLLQQKVPDHAVEALVFMRTHLYNKIIWSDGFELGGTIASAMRYLEGKGRENHENLGVVFTEEVKQGNDIRAAILLEKEKFGEQVINRIDTKFKEEIFTALADFLADQSEHAKTCKQTWKDLYTYWIKYVSEK